MAGGSLCEAKRPVSYVTVILDVLLIKGRSEKMVIEPKELAMAFSAASAIVIPPQAGIACQFSAYGTGVNAQCDGNLILFFSCLLHRINLDTFFFGELNPLNQRGLRL